MPGKLFILAALALITACSKDQVLCKDSLGKSRVDDLHSIPTDGNPSNVVVISMDTEPTKGSALFEANLKNLGYEYYLLGKTSTTGHPYPAKNGLFKQYIFSYRLFRYQEALSDIVKTRPNAIVVLSDASDVLFTQGPDVLAKRFTALNKEVVLTGEMGCCNINLVPWIEKFAKELRIDDPRSMDPQVVSIVELLGPMVAVKGADWGYGDAPVFLWSPEAQETMSLIKAIPWQSKYRYVNGGGIAGRASALQQAFREINPQDGDDDQGRWGHWYGKQGYGSGRATIDYQQSIFKMTNEILNHDGDFRLLFDDRAELPSRTEFQFVNTPASPMIYHCAGCSADHLRSFRQRIVNELGNFPQELAKFVNQC